MKDVNLVGYEWKGGCEKEDVMYQLVNEKLRKSEEREKEEGD